ncbi:MAG: site-2 protease family protein [bacterium]|nr:site-2 protease family protein [bacterium]
MVSVAENMIDFLIGYVIFLFVISVHECAHAWTADRYGDPTARLMGRMTLDPFRHIDPFGTVLIPLSPLLFGLLGGGAPAGFRLFGWARPVPVNPLKVRPWRLGNVLISVSGCASGFLVALAAALLLRVVRIEPATFVLLRMGSLAVWLSLFNLIPVPPLDGFHILTGLARIDPRRIAALEAAGPWLLLVLINTPFIGGILGPAYALLFGGAFRAIAGI